MSEAGPGSERTRYGWNVIHDVTCVEAPCCGFTFDAVHEDVDRDGYSCPCCPAGEVSRHERGQAEPETSASPALSTEDRCDETGAAAVEGACPVHGRDACLIRFEGRWLALVDRLCKENDRLREMFEWEAQQRWNGEQYDHGDWEDFALTLGLLVQVPATEEFKAEWDADEMLVLAWSPLARTALSEPHGGENG